ncbi:MAG: YidB family protein [Candidatus Limnocylindrales bacterium]
MDDLSNLSQGLGGGSAVPDRAALGGLASAVQDSGGLDGLLGKLRDAGLGEQVDSWVADGENQPVDPQRLGEALGPDTVQRLSAGSGLDIMSLLPMLAAFLPQIINMLTPGGKTPEGGLDSALGSGGVPDLGGLLGGVLGGGTGATAGSVGSAGGAGLDDLLGGLGGLLGGNKGR